MMHPLLITSIIVLLSSVACKTKKVNAPSSHVKPIVVERPPEEKIISPISPIDPREEVIGENLQTKDAKTEEDPVGEHKSLRIVVEPDPDADYIQFAICGKENSQNCNPSIKEPLAFASHMHSFPAPPEGDLEVYVRSCVAPNRAVNYQRPCGNWIVRPYMQAHNYDSEVRKLLIDNYIAAQRVLKECHKIQAALQEYQRNNKNSQSQFDTLVANYLNHIPPETCKTLMLSKDWQALEEQIAEENTKQSAKENEGSSIVLSLGVPAFIFGIVSYTTGVVYKNRFDENIAKHWTHLIKNYAGDQPRLRPYDSLDEINSRITEIDAYIKAIDRKPDTEAANFKSQKNTLEEERKFLVAYQEFAKDADFRSLASYEESEVAKIPQNLKKKINSLADGANIETANIYQKWVRQAEINKITAIEPILNGSGRIEGIGELEVKGPGNRKFKSTLAHDLKYTGIIGTTIGAILIGVEVFGLEVSTISDIDSTKIKLDDIYESIRSIRGEIKENQAQINSLIQG